MRLEFEFGHFFDMIAMPEDTTWLPARRPESLGSDDVHVWAIKLAADLSTMKFLEALLCAEERDRAGRFHFDRDRIAYTVGRGLLRWLIGRYQGCEPAHVGIRQGEHGKPELSKGDLKFNASRTDGLGLLAFTRGREIGVDIERIKPRHVSDQLARQSFSDWEYEQYSKIPEVQKTAAFFDCWTRKEAFIKAIGRGFTFPLDAFDVSVNPADKPQLLRVEGSAKKAKQWMMRTVPFPDTYSGVVIAGGQSWRLSCFIYTGPVNA